jgi:hypothetical protein
MSVLLVVVSMCVVSCNGDSESKLQETTMAEAVQETLTAQAISPSPPATCPEIAHPWDTSWLPHDYREVADQLNEMLDGTGLADQGTLILELSIEYGINPAFALAMFNKEAEFAKQGTRAQRNNNPGNIIATGECRGKPAGTACSGNYGETSTDGRFGVYPSMADGIAAYFKLLDSEYMPGTKRDCESIECIISAYCPPEECETEQYVEQITGWSKDYQCDLLGASTPAAVLAPKPTAPEVAVTVVPATTSPFGVTPLREGHNLYRMGDIIKLGELSDDTSDYPVHHSSAEDLILVILGWESGPMREDAWLPSLWDPSSIVIAVDCLLVNPSTGPIEYERHSGQLGHQVSLVSDDDGSVQRNLPIYGYNPVLGPDEWITLREYFEPAQKGTSLSLVYSPPLDPDVRRTAVIELGSKSTAVDPPLRLPRKHSQASGSVGEPVGIYDTNMVLTVLDVTSPPELSPEEEAPLPRYNLVKVSYLFENKGTETSHGLSTWNMLLLQDRNGREYPTQDYAGGIMSELEPGERAMGEAVFAVPETAVGLAFKAVVHHWGHFYPVRVRLPE